MSASGDRVTLRAMSRLDELTALSEALDAFLGSRNTDEETRYAVQFALEELFSNIVKYAFDDDRPHPVDIVLRLADAGLMLTMDDDGKPFDPTAAPRPDTTSALEDRPVGGLGLYLLRQMSSGMEYRRVGDRNRTTVLFGLRGSG